MKALFKIDGMHCSSCSLRIDGDLEEIAGVKTSETNFAKGECLVEYDDAVVTTENLISIIQTAGYIPKLLA